MTCKHIPTENTLTGTFGPLPCNHPYNSSSECRHNYDESRCNLMLLDIPTKCRNCFLNCNESKSEKCES